MNDKAVTPLKEISTSNIFATLIEVEEVEREAQGMDNSTKQQPGVKEKANGKITEGK